MKGSNYKITCPDCGCEIIKARAVEEITLQVQRDEQSGQLVAWWDDPNGSGGITTQGEDLRDLQQQIIDVVAVHFDEGEAPARIRTLDALRRKSCQL
jgi:hypothetical protein